jgi:hypothetical protein
MKSWNKLEQLSQQTNYYRQNKFVCHLEQITEILEQIRPIVRIKFYYS